MSDGTPTPAQPQLITGLASGIVTYCALIVAGLMALMATGEFSRLNELIKIAGAVAIITAMVGGTLALVSVGYGINYARRVEAKKAANAIESARYWSVVWSNLSYVAIAIASILASVLIFGFIFYAQQSTISGRSYLVELPTQPGDQQITSGDVACYPRPAGADQKMPKQVCILKK